MNLMTAAGIPSLESAIKDIAVPRVAIDYRIIAPGDEHALLAEERTAFATSVIKVQRSSGAARIVARDLMRRAGVMPQPVIKSTAGMPIWPDGIVGSLAHDATVAVAALARHSDYLSLGVDVEPAEPLAADLLELVTTSSERVTMRNALQGRLLFSIKEAVYKAVYPLDRIFLDHHDVEVDLAAQTATVRNGRIVRFVYSHTSHIVVLAFIRAMNPGAAG